MSEMDELAKLADLKDRGVLSSEEFEQKKKQLLESGKKGTGKKRRGWWWRIPLGILGLLFFVGMFHSHDDLDVNGLPKCDSDKAKDTVKNAVAHQALSNLVHLEILSFEDASDVKQPSQNDSTTECSAHVLTNTGKHLIYYTLSKTAERGNFYVEVKLGDE
jgi:hypothetical protein